MKTKSRLPSIKIYYGTYLVQSLQVCRKQRHKKIDKKKNLLITIKVLISGSQTSATVFIEQFNKHFDTLNLFFWLKIFVI